MEMETLLKELLRTVSHFDALDFLAEALTSPGDHGSWKGGPRKATATALKREKENERENAMDDDESRVYVDDACHL